MLFKPWRQEQTPGRSSWPRRRRRHATRCRFVAPGVGAQFGISDGPQCSSANLIGARTRQDLTLPIAAPELGVHSREDDTEFTDHVGMHLRGCNHTVAIPPVRTLRPSRTVFT